MSLRAHLSKPVVNLEGTLRSEEGLTVTVCEPGSTSPTTITLYSEDVDGEVLENPFVVTDGLIDFYIDYPHRFDLIIEAEDETPVTYPDIDVFGPAEVPTSLLLQSPDETVWRITIDDDGVISSEAD